MGRNAFKQRMQALKSYRESNPGKGYWDWKVQSFEDGMYNCDFNIKVNKDPLYSPKLTDKELNALLSYRRGEYFTDEEMYKYMNELIIRLHKEEIYDNESDATVSDT